MRFLNHVVGYRMTTKTFKRKTLQGRVALNEDSPTSASEKENFLVKEVRSSIASSIVEFTF